MVQRELLPALREPSAFKSYDAKEFALTVWALAKLGVSDKLVFAALVAQGMRKDLTNFNPQDVANTVWAFATANMADAGLFARLASEITRRRSFRDM